MSYSDDLAGRIQQRMDLLRLNAYSAAKRAGVGQDYIRDILRGRTRSPSAEKLAKLAVALETTIGFLLTGREEAPEIFDPTGRALPPPPASEPGGLPRKMLVTYPVRHELMADVWRPATQVTSEPIGWEPATIPPAYEGRVCWWELVRDDSISRYAPAGSLVLVAEMANTERDAVEEGALVVVQKRLTFEGGAVHLVERSARQIRFEETLQAWFMGYASLEEEKWPDWTDESWRSNDFSNFPEEERSELRARAEKYLQSDLAALDLGHQEVLRPPSERTPQGQKKVEQFLGMLPREAREFVENLERRQFQLVGRIIRVLTPVAPGADFGIRTRVQ